MTNPAYKIAISDGLRTRLVYLYTQSGLWTVPVDWNNVNNKIEAIGAGGGGSSNALGGGGGGGGAYTALSNISLTPGITYSITIGSAGTAGSPSGSAGTSTTFNTTTLIAAGGAGGVVEPGTASGGLASACTPSTVGIAQNGGSGGAGAGNASYPQSSMGGGGGGAAGPGYAGKTGGVGNLSIGSGGGGGAGGSSSTVGSTGSSVNAARLGGAGGVGPAGVGSGNGSASTGEVGLYGGGGGGGGFGNIAIVYSAGAGGLIFGTTPTVGGTGGSTTVTVLGITITGTGGQGSSVTTNTNAAPGTGTTTVVGSIYASSNGYGGLRLTNNYPGGGGGAIGGSNGSVASSTVGGAGGQSVDFNGLQSVVTNLGYTFSGVGAGGTAGSPQGGDATGFGCGGGGGYGSFSITRYGGRGLYGGGGGGYAGTAVSGTTGASGGNGIVILQYVTNTGSTTNVALTDTNTYRMPDNTASFKIWAIGGGGGSGHGMAGGEGTPGGGAGGIAYMSVSGGYNGGSGGGGGNGTVSSNGWVTNLLQYAGPGGGGGGAAPAGGVTTISGSGGTAGSGGYYGGGGGGGVTGASGAPGLLAISYVPTGYSSVSDVDDLLVLRSNFVPGNMWAWGSNSFGALGDGGVVASASSPIHIGSATDWKDTSVYSQGYASRAISTSGNLYVWGQNSLGQLGLNDTVSRVVPTQLGTSTWKQLSFGGGGATTTNFALAIRSDSSMWAWGDNSIYQLGNGTATSVSSPVQVGKSLYNWKQVSAGYGFGAAIGIDGTLWTWGFNGSGQLGHNDTVTKSTPVQVGTLTSWKYVAASLLVSGGSCYGLTSDGSLYAWGYNLQGQLGLGNITARSTPTKVGSDTWQSIEVGLGHVVAVNAAGKLFTWGINGAGQLGQNDLTTSRSFPVQVGLLTNWKTAIAGGLNSGSIKSDNTLWTWGRNNSGQLGLGDTADRSSPVQVGSLTTWKSVSMGSNHTVATIYSF